MNIEEIEAGLNKLAKELKKYKQKKPDNDIDWTPGNIEDYSCIELSNSSGVCSITNTNVEVDSHVINSGLYRKTETACQNLFKLITAEEKLRRLAAKNNGDEVVDWKNLDQNKHRVIYNYDIENWVFNHGQFIRAQGSIVFLNFTDDKLQQIIYDMGDQMQDLLL